MSDGIENRDARRASEASRPLRIFHGPINITGIGRYLADWQRAQGAVSDFIVFTDDTMRQNNHYNLHLERRSIPGKLWVMLRLFVSSLMRYDIFHLYFAKSLLPFNADLPFLKLFGKKVIMTYCGTDIRLYEVESARNPYVSLMNVGGTGPRFDRRKKRIMRWQNMWVDRFIAVRNLYASATRVIPPHKVERDLQVNTTMDMDIYEPKDYKTNEIPLIVHAPSEPKVKGTEYVEKAIESLKAGGYRFEYRMLHGVPNDEAHRIYREEADIIIDQLMAGGFGTLATEAMYYGKPVCCYLIDEVTQWYPDCPIVNCNLVNLKEKLVWLIENPEERTKLGKAGRRFVEKHFSREKVNRQVWELYRELLRGRKA
jgi:glycosyltransferase involved in cell wall biosynthesis